MKGNKQLNLEFIKKLDSGIEALIAVKHSVPGPIRRWNPDKSLTWHLRRLRDLLALEVEAGGTISYWKHTGVEEDGSYGDVGGSVRTSAGVFNGELWTSYTPGLKDGVVEGVTVHGNSSVPNQTMYKIAKLLEVRVPELNWKEIAPNTFPAVRPSEWVEVKLSNGNTEIGRAGDFSWGDYSDYRGIIVVAWRKL